jgi:hypothetical protein
MKKLTLLSLLGFMLMACSGPKKEEVKEEIEPEKVDMDPGLVSIVTNSMDIVMSDTLHSGLNHLVYENKSNMVHLLLFNKVPDSISLVDYHSQLTKPFQDLMDAINNNVEPPNNFPEWLPAMVNTGGVGLISPGLRAESYVNFPPGNYVVECYIKSDGVFHSSTGMLKQLRVIEKSTQQLPPQETLGIKLSPEGIALDGELPKTSGQVVFRVDYGETKLFENFTRPDVNLARVTDENNLDSLEDYMDWRKPNGMTIEAPVTFLGGVQEMPEGNVSYFSANLEPGKYVLIGEVPEPKKDGFYLEFEIE